MAQTRYMRSAFVLSTIIATLATLASAGGLFINGLYRDNTFVTSAWKGSDLVTLVVAIPLLVAALIIATRGSRRALLVWFGMLDYMLYNYAFYLFGAAFNWFFLVYAALFTLSILALVFGLSTLDVSGVSREFRPSTPVKSIGGYMLFVAIGLSTVYVAQSVGFIVGGQLPAIVVMTDHPTSVVFALDLSLVVPGLVLGAIWLWKRHPWGYVLAGIFNVKGAVYTLGLAAGSAWASTAGVSGAAAEIPLWLFLTTGGLIASAFLLGNMQPAKQ